MARTFHRKRASHPIAELNVTNLIDLGFTLLIIFMIATPLIQKEQTIPVNLPTEGRQPQVQPPSGTVFQAISIDRYGHYYFGNRPVSFSQLETLVEGLGKEAKPPVIRIRADGSLQYQQVVRVMSLMLKNNLTRFTLDTKTGD